MAEYPKIIADEILSGGTTDSTIMSVTNDMMAQIEKREAAPAEHSDRINKMIRDGLNNLGGLAPANTQCKIISSVKMVIGKEKCVIKLKIVLLILELVPGAKAAGVLAQSLFTQLTPAQVQKMIRVHEDGHAALCMLEAGVICSMASKSRWTTGSASEERVKAQALADEKAVDLASEKNHQELDATIPKPPSSATPADVDKQAAAALKAALDFVDVALANGWISEETAKFLRNHLKTVQGFVGPAKEIRVD
ncbi:MAG: hypothetical protein HYY17_03255 [Planctomycetes bacterium]|nr:hypothetical protein [Planctomycetota bacterium]